MWNLLKTFWEAVPYCSFQRPSHSELEVINISYMPCIAFEIDPIWCITMRKQVGNHQYVYAPLRKYITSWEIWW
jgi:hypothetical protein